jgi:hypothetical protein
MRLRRSIISRRFTLILRNQRARAKGSVCVKSTSKVFSGSSSITTEAPSIGAGITPTTTRL